MVVSIGLERQVADVRVANDDRIHDFRTRMVIRKYKSGYQQLHVSLGVPFLLQHSLGVDTPLDTLRIVQEHHIGVRAFKRRRRRGKQENDMKQHRIKDGRLIAHGERLVAWEKRLLIPHVKKKNKKQRKSNKSTAGIEPTTILFGIVSLRRPLL